jgi:hypothetical protein
MMRAMRPGQREGSGMPHQVRRRDVLVGSDVKDRSLMREAHQIQGLPIGDAWV